MLKNALIITGTCIGWLAVVVTCLPWSTSSRWWIRIWDFPRLQIAAAALIALAVLVADGVPRSGWRVLSLVAIAGALLYQISRTLPYTPIAPVQAAAVGPTHAGHSVTVMLCNVLMSNRDASRLLDLIETEDPDIVLAVETDAWWASQLEPVQAGRPYHVSRPLDNTYGMTLFSRFPLSDIVVRELTCPDIPSIRADVHVSDDDVFTFYGIHPPPPFPGLADASTPRDAELVLVAREVATIDQPVVVAGDLNDVAWSTTSTLFQQISRLLDPRRGRGLFNTFHAQYPFARWPLDHVFFSREFAVIELRRLADVGSDHFPILAQLAIAPRAGAHHDAPPPRTPSAEERADEILETARADTDADLIEAPLDPPFAVSAPPLPLQLQVQP